MKLRFTRQARQEFLSAIDYIRTDRPEAARQLQGRAEEALRRLEMFPESGRRLPEFPALPYREVLVSPYRFFYKVTGETVWIVAVWHGAQLPETPE